MLAAALLVIALGGLVWFLKGDLAEYRLFKRLPDTGSRQRRYRLWIAKAGIAFALPALIGLALLGRLDALVAMPSELATARDLIPRVDGDLSGFLGGVLGGAATGGLILGVVIRLRKDRRVPQPLGDIGSLMPRNRAEIRHTAALSVAAGVTEELAFRLYLPLLIALLTGSAVAGFLIAVALFGAMHGYQGWVGVAATSVVGLLMTAMYLMTGALWIAILLHTLIDLNALVLRPALAGAWRNT